MTPGSAAFDAGPNGAQVGYWNGPGGADWSVTRERLDKMLEPFDRLLFEAADLSAGHSVLDIGCGCGTTSLVAAQRVGQSGRVVGVDVSSPMLEVARGRVRSGQSVTFVEADAQTTDFASLRVDRIISRFGVMFFANTTTAFANIASAGSRGATFSFVCWQEPKRNPWFAFAGRAVAEFVELPRGGRGGPGPFALSDHVTIAQAVIGAGMSDLEITEHEVAVDFGGGGSVDELVEFAMDFGPIGRAVAGDERLAHRAREALSEAITERWNDGRVELDSAVWLVRAAV